MLLCLIPFVLHLVASANHHHHHHHHHHKHAIYPEAFNLALGASIEANATCGRLGPETYCRGRNGGCGVCDERIPEKRHPPSAAIDSQSHTTWQAPTSVHYVTITLDLKQVYQVLHVRVRSGNSPRPGNWILERSVDGRRYQPWQYFATSGEECWSQYGTKPHHGHMPLKSDSEVLCTTVYSKTSPADGGESHAFLTQGRPGFNTSSQEYLEFTKARFVRLRLQKLNYKSGRLPLDHTRRMFYSIKDILIQGRCICNGHASKCHYDASTGEGVCECQHNTCGPNCDRCCPLYNQEEWRIGTHCSKCQCHGHATTCRYSQEVAAAALSLNAKGNYSGGGECIGCSKHTMGVNCERCEDGWFRPPGVRPDAQEPCLLCDCHSLGSTGVCTKDDSQAHLGKPAGSCVCREGYMGPRCGGCAPGYKGFPHCNPCPCDPRGMLPVASCDRQCVCKEYVEGEECERCKTGFFHLDQDNPDGCTECFCSGVATKCKEATNYMLSEIVAMDGWVVTDISASLKVKPYWREPGSRLVSVAYYQLSGIEDYYWMAPSPYRGNHLTSYGSSITFSVSWDVMRGDTSGKPTIGPDLVLIGHNGLRIGYGETWHRSKNISITVGLMEEGWYHVEEQRGVVTRHRRDPGSEVSRAQFMSVLSDIKHLLVRAKFHTDQAEGSLESCVLETGVKGSSGGTTVGFLEECSCPEGYKGLSCETCDFGYARITSDSASPHRHAVCTKCNCHGHAATCDPITGQCGVCEHNTEGANCERCTSGYHGDATVGTPNDCRKCACPLLQESNNFSPTCQSDHLGYFCNDCPKGHTGRHCERCEAGYYGNPEEIGSKCERCDCNDGPCDTLTGQCLTCLGNTEGWRCDRCKPNHYGDPLSTGCLSCNCSGLGSFLEEGCDVTTGQCKCKEKYTGRQCDRCETGHGGVSEGCVRCECDSIGAKSSLCDPVTGDCICHPGVTGSTCDSCLPKHYGYSHTGCKRCDCNSLGSEDAECDSFTGQCTCRDKVVGRTCDTCRAGYWGLGDVGCQPCECDPLGSKDQECDSESGQCHCKPGVGGLKCDRCLPQFYRMSHQGCSECDICELPGHVCDPDTGRCVCPPLTTGPSCETCLPNTWGYNANKGCKTCDCDNSGSLGGQCDTVTGKCACRSGYQGSRCDSCSRGHFGYPHCRPCLCAVEGTQPQHCHGGVCVCDHTGQCPCKDNVGGSHCDTCKDGTFGLSRDNSVGCTQCFCFGRSSKCTEAGLLAWGLIRPPRPRILAVNYDNDTSMYNGESYPVNTQEICYINLAMPGGNEIVTNNAKKLNATNNLRIIPSDDGDIELGVSYLFYTPVYWQLPKNFLGDRILSYGGFFKFTVETEGETTLLPHSVLESYPLIQIQGNDRIVLEHFPFHSSTSHHHVRLHESLWRVKNNPKGKVSKETFMVALQNVQHILIRASDSVDFRKAILKDVTLETAVPAQGLATAKGIEHCACPVGYNASSCQNPSIGYFRERSKLVTSTIIIELVGEAKPCECNDRSNVCNIETGHCIDCLNHTGGIHCETCADGYYGEPQIGVECAPCPCPSPEQNFASSCSVKENKETVCHCKQGYTGRLCNRCSYGWFGYPGTPGGFCQPCECNPHGSVSDECGEETGQCNCRPGVTGRDCSTCAYSRHVLTPHTGCTHCDDGCITQLLNATDTLARRLDEGTRHIAGGVIAPPWEILFGFEENIKDIDSTWKQHISNTLSYKELNETVDDEVRTKMKSLYTKIQKLKTKGSTSLEDTLTLKDATDRVANMITSTRNDIDAVIRRLEAYIEGDRDQQSSKLSTMLAEARHLLRRVNDTDLEPNRNRAEDVLRSCRNVLNDLQYEIGDRYEIDQLRSRINKLNERNDDLVDILDAAKKNVATIKEKGIIVRNLTDSLQQKIENIFILEGNVTDILNSTKSYNILSDVYIREAEDNLEALLALKKLIEINRRALEKRRNHLDQLNYLKTEYVIPAQEHADYLMNVSKEFTNLLKTDAGDAVQASKAYKDIVDALDEARSAAHNASKAANKAYETAYPEVDSLVDRANHAKEISLQLMERGQDQLKRGTKLENDLISHKEAIEQLKDVVRKTAVQDNSLAKQLLNLGTQTVGEKSQETIAKAEDLIEMSEEIQDDVAFVTHNLNKTLRAELNQLESDGELSLNAAQHIIAEAQGNIRKAQDVSERLSLTVRKQNEFFAEWNDTIASKLEALRSKITQTRHIAESIRLSMTSIGDTGGSCVRTYQPSHLEPSTTTSIVLTYAISSQLRDALLFYLPSSTTEDFVAVEMVNRKMRFVWNVGGGVGEVTHPLHIQTAGDLSKDQHWYRVEAERISNVGRVWVRPQVSIGWSAGPTVNSSSGGHGRLDVGPGDRVWVGGTDRRPSALRSTQPGLVGCLHTLYLNGRPIGLWDFRTQNPNSCTACIEGAEEATDESSYSFSGDGYAILKHGSAAAYNKYLFSVSLAFKTFDHNALIFLALDKLKERFISLTMSEGRVVFRIVYGGDSSLEISTVEKYNTGNWTRVEASRYFDRKKKLEKGVLKVGEEVRDGAPTPPPGQEAIPDMSSGIYYLGGVAPGGSSLRLPQPFLGCMADLQIAQEGYNPLKGQFWGVQASCSSKPIAIAGFHGNGYIELPPQNLKKRGSFGFVFSTSQKNALLMLSTFEGMTGPLEDNEESTNLIEQEERQSYYWVSIRRGQIDVRVNRGKGESRLASVGSDYSDGLWHSVSVRRAGRKLELRVDDQLDATTLLGGDAPPSRPPGPLYLGGLPYRLNGTTFAAATPPFVGTIKDLIFNDMIVGLDEAVRVVGAEVGRMGPSGRGDEPAGGAAACRKPPSYTLEPGAVKFGDSRGSHAQVNFRKRSLLQSNFTLQLDFRTFHPNGLLFMIPGVRGKQPHYLMAALRNGRVQIVLKGRRKIETTAQTVFNDGVWHRMILEKQGRNMVLRVDSMDPEKTKTPKKMNVGSIVYIGGLPQTGIMLPEPLLHKLEGFKGCIRGLRMNSQDEDLAGDKSTPFRVGQCFPQVERGSYFPGDAYAVYKTKFNVGSFLALELEFRTSELNGVLLSVSDPDSYPALSLELHNGKVVMGGDMGDRRPFKVERSFPEEFTACDNKWHRVQAHYAHDELTLRVDSLEQKYWLSDNGHLTEAKTNSPLYIGGLPEQASSGTLQSRENFRGCIRNVIINTERRDWTDMASLHNILLSSCPVPG